MNPIKNEYFTIPFDLASYVYFEKKCPQFALYLSMKAISDGILKDNRQVFTQVSELSGIKDRCTYKKYLKELIKDNWIGYNSTSKTFFIRSFSVLRKNVEKPSKRGARLEA